MSEYEEYSIKAPCRSNKQGDHVPDDEKHSTEAAKDDDDIVDIELRSIRNNRKEIHGCIGRILLYFGDKNKKGGRAYDGTTGTVFRKLPNNYFLVLTCAHTLVQYDDISQKETKPIQILFFPRGESEFKNRLSCVETKVYSEYISKNSLCPNDLAVILFHDSDGRASQHFADIDVEKVLEICAVPEDEDDIIYLHIFGYPIKSEGLLQGMTGEANSRSSRNDDRGRLWEYNEINTYPGQSGSAILKKLKQQQKYKIYGVHTFGNESKQKNCGIFFDPQKVDWIKKVCVEFESMAITLAKRANDDMRLFEKYKNEILARQDDIDATDAHKTTVDDFYGYVIDNTSISTKEAVNVCHLLGLEEYDSDALEDDISEGDKKCSEIYKFIKNSQSLQGFTTTRVANYYQVGYAFKYWEYYQKHDMNYTIPKDEDLFNINDHSGYPTYELYVDRKYKDLDEEMRACSSINIEQIKATMKRSTKLIHTDRAEQITLMTAADVDHQYHYDINAGTSLKEENLFCVIFFADYRDWCREFKAAFRKKYSSETLDSVKKRNSEFWHFSKILHETVAYFGDTKHTGPFYIGLERAIYVAEFNARIYEPIGVTKEREVAMLFARRNGNKGMVLQLNYDGYSRHKLRMFDTRWLCNKPDEYALLCCGGHYRMKLESIRLLLEPKNFEEYNELLYLFDCMLNGTHMSQPLKEISEVQKGFLSDLISYFSADTNSTNGNYPEFIVNCFASFVYSKTEIVINLWCIHKWFKQLKDLIIDENNMIKPIIVKLFCNLEKIFIYSTSRNGKHEYRFDLSKLVSLINDSDYNESIMMIAVKATRPRTCCYAMSDEEESDDDNEKGEGSWIQHRNERKALLQLIREKNLKKTLKISFQPSVGKYNDEDCLILSKQTKWKVSPLEESLKMDPKAEIIDDCSKEQMLSVLKKYGFSEAAKKEAVCREQHEWSLEKYKQNIITYFHEHQFDGRAFKTKGKIKFTQELNDMLGDEDLTVAIATLYRVIKRCDINKMLNTNRQ